MDSDKIQTIMDKIDEFYFGDDDNSGEEIFNRFAEKHSHLFEPGFNAQDGENKLEYALFSLRCS